MVLFTKEVTAMKYCKYNFTFYNEYMEDIEEGLCEIMRLCSGDKNSFYFETNQEKIYLISDDNGAIIFTSYPNSYIYMVSILAKSSFKEKIEEFLFYICDEIEEDYGENHRHEIKDCSKKEMSEIIELSKKLDFEKYVKEFLK